MSTTQVKPPTSRIEGKGKVLRWVPNTLTARAAAECGAHTGSATATSAIDYKLINTMTANQIVVGRSGGVKWELLISAKSSLGVCPTCRGTTIYSLEKDPKAKLTVKTT